MSTPTKPKSDTVVGLSQTDAKVLIWGIFCITDQGKVCFPSQTEPKTLTMLDRLRQTRRKGRLQER